MHNHAKLAAATVSIMILSQCAPANGTESRIMICEMEKATRYLEGTDDFERDGIKRLLAFKYDLSDTSEPGWTRAKFDTFEYYDPSDLFHGKRVYTLARSNDTGTFGTMASPDDQNSYSMVFLPGETETRGLRGMLSKRESGHILEPSMILYVGYCDIDAASNADSEFDKIKQRPSIVDKS